MTLRSSARLLAAALVLATSAMAAQAQDMRLRIHNNTGLTLYKFYSTNSGASKWGSDVMGSSTLASGSSMRLNFANANGYCLFDFRAVFADGTVLQRANVDVCSTSDYTYNP